MKKHVWVTGSHLYLNEQLPVHVNRVSESFELAQHTHEFHEFSYVSEGSGYHYIEGEVLPVTKGDLFYLPVGVSHVFRPTSPGRGRLIVYNCLFGASFVARLKSGLPAESAAARLLSRPFPEQPWRHRRDTDRLYQQLFDAMFEEFQAQRPDFIPMLQAEVTRLLIRFTRPGEDTGARDRDAAIDGISRRIKRHPGDKYDASALAEECGLSERQFRRRFAAHSGMTLTEYVQKARIETSCRLLKETPAAITLIAQQAGYRDMKYFNRLFKKVTGMAPRTYRERG